MRFYYFSATHWDREWYQPRQVYRKRLLTLTRRVLDLLEQQPEYRHFIFDGQTVVLDDIAEVHPEWKPRLTAAISGGRLKVGPWYVMPDEFLVSGEALIRNLQIGRTVAEEYGSAPWPVGYVCDIFGHMAQLPQLFAGFGLKGAVVWRGLASTEPARFLWESPDGTRIRTIHLMPRNGYGQFTLDVRGGTDRSPEGGEFRERLRQCVEQDTAYWGKEAFLLSDGLDHSCPPEDPVQMLRWIAEEYPDAELVQTDCLDLFEREFGPEVSTVLRGELIHPADINGNWQISGTVSSRSDVKRANDLCSNRLELLVEPLLAERAAAGETGDLGLLHYLWKELVKNHAHDSICGCSIDSVHRRMLGRFGEVFDGARAIVDDQIQLDRERLTGVRLEKQSGDPADEVAPDGRYLLRLRNPLPFDVDRTAEYEIRFPAAAPYVKRQAEPFGYEFVNSFQLRDEAGELVPYQIVSIRRNQMRQFQWNVFRRYDVYRVTFRTKLRAAGWTTLRLEPSPDFVRSYRTMRTSQRSATNGILQLDFHPAGTFDVIDLRSGRSFRNWNEFRFDREIGDGWNHVEPVGSAALLCSSESSLRVTLDGPERTMFEITRRYHLPASLRYEGGLGENYVGIREAEESAEVILRTTVTLDRDSDQLGLRFAVENHAEDFRLQLIAPTGIPGNCFAGQNFAILNRKAGRELGDATEGGFEREFIEKNVSGLIGKRDASGGVALLFAAGIHEAGAIDNAAGELVVTLLRAFRRTVNTDGEMEGQQSGRSEFLCAARFFGAGTDDAELWKAVQILRAETPVHLLKAEEARPFADESFCRIDGKLNFSALKPAADREPGSVVLRLVNLSPEPRRGSVTVAKKLRAAEFCRLDETPVKGVEATDGGHTVPVEASPWEIVTLRLRF